MSIKEIKKAIARMPAELAAKAASGSAEAITALARDTFSMQQDAYGDPWEGAPTTLVQTGALRSGVSYQAIGPTLRAKLTVPYAKYHMGKRPIFPRVGDDLPPAYAEAIAKALGK